MGHIFAEPLFYVISLFAISFAALSVKRYRCGTITCGVGLVMLVLLGFERVPMTLVSELERKVPNAGRDLSKAYGVIILGGAQPRGSAALDQELNLNENAERIVATAILARNHPSLHVVFSGGSECAACTVVEADRAKALLIALGVREDGVRIERESKTTEENARNTAAMLSNEKTRDWRLATSAWHMPRAIDAFRAAGFSNVSAMPVDYRANHSVEWSSYSMQRSLSLWRIALQENIGLQWYRLRRCFIG